MPTSGMPVTSGLISPEAGGTLRSPDGVVLIVPPNVVKRRTAAHITKMTGAWDVHIDAPWTGTVTVSLPGQADSLFAHQVAGAWTLERATQDTDHITATLKSLSLVTVLKCLIGVPLPSRIARCMIEAGVRKLIVIKAEKTAANKLLNIFFPQCDLDTAVLDFVEILTKIGTPDSQCAAGLPTEPHSTTPAPTTSAPMVPVQLPPTVEPHPEPTPISVQLIDNPFQCDGVRRLAGYVSGAHAAERIHFNSPQLGALADGIANSVGRASIYWVCPPSAAGSVWTVNVRTATGATTQFSITGSAPLAPQPQPVTMYSCANDYGNDGHYVPPNHYFRDAFVANGSVITGGELGLGANPDGQDHRATVGVWADGGLTVPIATTTVSVSGYGGVSFTLPSTHVSPGTTYYIGVRAIGDLTAYNRVDTGCFIGKVVGTS